MLDDKFINKLVKQLEPIANVLHGLTFFVAGGYIRDNLLGETPNDIDLFFKSYQDAEKAEALFFEKKAEIVKTGDYFTELKFHHKTIQIIKGRNFKKPKDVDFDFRMCQASLGFNPKGQVGFWCDENFKDDVLNKYLVPNNIKNPTSAIERVIRFTSRGWVLRRTDLFKLVNYINDYEGSLSEDWYNSVEDKKGLE